MKYFFSANRIAELREDIKKMEEKLSQLKMKE